MNWVRPAGRSGLVVLNETPTVPLELPAQMATNVRLVAVNLEGANGSDQESCVKQEERAATELEYQGIEEG